MKNNNYLILCLLAIVVLFISNCGTIGGIQKYKINASKSELDEKILSLYSTNPNIVPKEKWEIRANESKERIKHLTMRFFYFNSNPEEMLVFSYIEHPDNWETVPTCRIGIIATIRYNPQKKILYFYKDENLSDEEKEKLRIRFEKEVLNKLNIEYERDDSY